MKRIWMLGAIFASLGISSATACSCFVPKGGWRDEKGRVAWLMAHRPTMAIFQGRVAAIADIPNERDDAVEAMIEVLEVRRGPTPPVPIVRVRTFAGDEGANCGLASSLADYRRSGAAVWFFAARSEDFDSPLWISSCAPPVLTLE